MSVQSQTSPSQASDQGNQPATGKRKLPRSWWIPWIYVGLIVLVACVNGVMIYFAVTTNSGLETDDAYRKGIKYNQMIAGQRAQDERGWQVGLEFNATDKQKGRIDLILRDKDGNMLRDANVQVTALRPVVQGHDMPVEMSYLGDGHYGADVSFPLQGVWDLRLVVTHPAGDYQDSKRIWVR